MGKRILLFLVVAVVVFAAGGYTYLSLRGPNALPPERTQVRMTPETVARGEYLFTVAAVCDGCHSQRDFTKFSGPVVVSGRGKGVIFAPELGLPGTVVAPNITTDVETGIGGWTDGEKIRAIREGVGRDGRALFPMMPYQTYRDMSDADVEALVAYMNTLPPVRNSLPRTELNFPVNLLIKSAPKPSRKVAAPNESDRIAYGKYLAAMAGCGDCHTKKDKGEPVPGMTFAGGEPFDLGSGKAVSANITPDLETGIGKWSEDYFIERFHQYRQYLKGQVPPATSENFTIMDWLGFTKMSREELGAIYAYLKTQPTVVNAVETHPAAK